MSDVRYIQHHSHLEVIASGCCKLEVVRKHFANILSESRLAGLACILIDHRSIEGLQTATSRVLLALTIQAEYELFQRVAESPLRIACLGLANAVSTRTGSVVFRSADLPVASFTNRTEAMEWLGIG